MSNQPVVAVPERGIFWKKEKDEDPWKYIPDTPEARVGTIAKGAMFFSNTSFASRPLKAPEERRDLLENAVHRWAERFCSDFDDSADPMKALADLQKLAARLDREYGVDPKCLLYFYSGSKGFHLDIPVKLFGPEADAGDPLLPLIFDEVAGKLLADLETADHGIYGNMGYGRQYRIPNVRRRNGRHKIPLTFAEVDPVFGLGMGETIELSKNRRLLLPPPEPETHSEALRKLFLECREKVYREVQDRPKPQPMSEERREALEGKITPCLSKMLSMRDYEGRELNFNKMHYPLLIPQFKAAGFTREEALEVAYDFLVGFAGSGTYTSPQSRIDHFLEQWGASNYPQDCRVTRGLLGPGACTGCEVYPIWQQEQAKAAFETFKVLDNAVEGEDFVIDQDDQGEDVVGAASTSGRAFGFLGLEEIVSAPRPTRWLIKDYLEEDVLAVMFGDPETMKTFVALDMGLCIASGTPWHGQVTPSPGPVFYIAGEGFRGLGKRTQAWLVSHGVDQAAIPFFVSNAAAQFLDARHAREVEAAVASLAEQHGEPKLIVVDTLSRNFGPGDENSVRDMAAFVAALDKLKARFGCAILVVHHSGIADKNRSRGPGVLRAALEFEYKMAVNGKTRVLSCEKAKDHEHPPDIAFEPKVVGTGWFESDGIAEIKSCVLISTATPRTASKETKLTGAKLIAFNALLVAYDQAKGPCHVDAWREEAYKLGISTEGADAKRKAFRRTSKDLAAIGLVQTDGVDLWWPAEK